MFLLGQLDQLGPSGAAIAYYFSAYCELLGAGRHQGRRADKRGWCPRNFGNILAAYFAKQCGLPIAQFICASTRTTSSPTLSVLATTTAPPFHLTLFPLDGYPDSSNLERLLFLLADGNDKALHTLMEQLSSTGRYDVGPALLQKLQHEFWAGCASDEETLATIRATFEQHGYLCDTHTAVGLKVCADYYRETGDATPAVVASTASPFKFAGSVLPAVGGEQPGDDFALLDALARKSGLPIPPALGALREKQERFTESCAPAAMKAAVAGWLGL